MTKHTPDFLRARSSNLSLRAASMESSVASLAIPQPRIPEESELSAESRSFILSCMEAKTATENEVCPRCARALNIEQKGQVSITPDRDACKICLYRMIKPEYFTKPFCSFLTENPTIFHAVDYFKKKMLALGFKEVSI